MERAKPCGARDESAESRVGEDVVVVVVVVGVERRESKQAWVWIVV